MPYILSEQKYGTNFNINKHLLFLIKNLYYSFQNIIHTRCSQIMLSQVFPDFSGSSRTKKSNKSQTKRVNMTYSISVRINRLCQLHILSFILYSLYFLTNLSNFYFRIHICHRLRTTLPQPGWENERAILHCLQPLTRPSPPPIIYINHRASGYAYIFAPATASNKDLLSSWLQQFFDAATVDDDRNFWPIRCFLY